MIPLLSRAISDRFRDALYKSTLLYFTFISRDVARFMQKSIGTRWKLELDGLPSTVMLNFGEISSNSYEYIVFTRFSGHCLIFGLLIPIYSQHICEPNDTCD